MPHITKPKKLKYPKKPKASASVPVMERYLERRREVDKINAQRLREYEAAKKKHASLKKQIAKF